MLAFITINYGEKFFLRGVASCRSIFIIFPANSKRQRRDRISPGRKPWVKE